MRTVNYSKHIWEGWTVRDFIMLLYLIDYCVRIVVMTL